MYTLLFIKSNIDENNIELLSKSKNIEPSELTACVLKRSRHDAIVKTLSEMHVKINFITDGDLSGAISVADSNTGIDIYMGIGGAPEGVLSAAALTCLGCQMQTRLVFQDDEEEKKKIETEREDVKLEKDDRNKRVLQKRRYGQGSGQRKVACK